MSKRRYVGAPSSAARLHLPSPACPACLGSLVVRAAPRLGLATPGAGASAEPERRVDAEEQEHADEQRLHELRRVEQQRVALAVVRGPRAGRTSRSSRWPRSGTSRTSAPGAPSTPCDRGSRLREDVVRAVAVGARRHAHEPELGDLSVERVAIGADRTPRGTCRTPAAPGGCQDSLSVRRSRAPCGRTRSRGRAGSPCASAVPCTPATYRSSMPSWQLPQVSGTVRPEDPAGRVGLALDVVEPVAVRAVGRRHQAAPAERLAVDAVLEARRRRCRQCGPLDDLVVLVALPARRRQVQVVGRATRGPSTAGCRARRGSRRSGRPPCCPRVRATRVHALRRTAARRPRGTWRSSPARASRGAGSSVIAARSRWQSTHDRPDCPWIEAAKASGFTATERPLAPVADGSPWHARQSSLVGGLASCCASTGGAARQQAAAREARNRRVRLMGASGGRLAGLPGGPSPRCVPRGSRNERCRRSEHCKRARHPAQLWGGLSTAPFKSCARLGRPVATRVWRDRIMQLDTTGRFMG